MNSPDDPSAVQHLVPPDLRDDDPALLLVESLIHGLVAAGAIDRDQAIEIVSVAVDVKLEIAHHRGDDPADAAHAARALTAIEDTLRLEGPSAV